MTIPTTPDIDVCLRAHVATAEQDFASLQELCEVDSWVRYKCPICGAIFDICIGD